MSHYRVTVPFTAFQRGYAPGVTLTDADLACWEPEAERARELADLVASGTLEPLAAAAPAAKYPPTWGGRKPAEDPQGSAA